MDTYLITVRLTKIGEVRFETTFETRNKPIHDIVRDALVRILIGRDATVGLMDGWTLRREDTGARMSGIIAELCH